MDSTGNFIVFRLYEKHEGERGRKGEEVSNLSKVPLKGRGMGEFQLRQK